MKVKDGDIIVIGEDGFALSGDGSLRLFVIVKGLWRLFIKEKGDFRFNQTLLLTKVHPRLRRKFIKIGEL